MIPQLYMPGCLGIALCFNIRDGVHIHAVLLLGKELTFKAL